MHETDRGARAGSAIRGLSPPPALPQSGSWHAAVAPDPHCRMTLEMLLRIRSKLVERENGVRLRDYLSVPYVLEGETVEISAGSWIRRVAYPELSGCTAEAVVVEEALHQLERMRIEIIVRMVGEGLMPPVPRPPLPHCDPVWVAQQAGLGDHVIALIDREAVSIVPET